MSQEEKPKIAKPVAAPEQTKIQQMVQAFQEMAEHPPVLDEEADKLAAEWFSHPTLPSLVPKQKQKLP